MLMEPLVTTDTTTLSYWLNWRVLVCAIWVFTPMVVASLMIWKYEYLDHSESDREGSQRERAWLLYDLEAWRPCIKEIHPMFLMAFRIIAFLLLLGALTVDVAVHGGVLFYYYTQWTFALVTIYFGFGSLLSIFGCYQHHKECHRHASHQAGIEVERDIYAPLRYGETANGIMVINLDYEEKIYGYPSVWGHLFEVMFQMTAGAVMLTDCVYWSVIFPFLTIRDYELNALTVIAHSLNAITLLSDAALNCLRFPLFRISYFILWTGIYVIFQWIIHACFSIWWPYPFLELSAPDAPRWYLYVALLHIPCYGIFALFVEAKHYILSRWFPHSYQCLNRMSSRTTSLKAESV